MWFSKDVHRILIAVVLVLAVSLPLVVQSASIGNNQATPGTTLGNKTEIKVAIADRAYLQDKTKFKFLQSCEGNVAIDNQLICQLYMDLTTTLAEREEIRVSVIEKMLSEKQESTICGNLSDIIQKINDLDANTDFASEPEQNKRKRLANKGICTLSCTRMVNETDVEVKPICRMLLWGFQQLLSSEIKLSESTNDSPVKLEQEEKQHDDMKKTVNDTIKSGIHGQNVNSIPLNMNETNREVSNKDVNAQKANPTGKSLPSLEASKVTPSNDETQEDDQMDSMEDEKDKENNENIVNETLDTQRREDDIGDDPTEDQNNEFGDDPVNEPQPQPQQPKPLPGSNDNNLDEVQLEEIHEDPFFEESDSNFFSYFLLLMFACIACYVAYHNKTKLIALLLEGRRTNSSRGGFSKGRKHTAAYRKLDSNLEEAITSSAATNSRSPSQIIY